MFGFLASIFCLAAGNSQNAAKGGNAELDAVRVSFDAAVKKTAEPLVQLQNQYAGRLATLQAIGGQL